MRPPSTYRHLEQADIELAGPNSLSVLLPSCFLPPTSFPPQARSAVSPLYTTEGKISISLSLSTYIYIYPYFVIVQQRYVEHHVMKLSTSMP
jgi:hypothetical protein